MKIEDKGHMVIIWENFLDWYDEETDALMDTAPIRFENGRIEEICDEYIALSKEDGFVIYIVNGIGDVENILSTDGELMSTKEAAELWDIDESYIRKRISDFPPGTVRKFGKQWVVSRKGMEKIFGKRGKTMTLGQFIEEMKKGYGFYMPTYVKSIGNELERRFNDDDKEKEVTVKYTSDHVGEGPNFMYRFIWEVSGIQSTFEDGEKIIGVNNVRVRNTENGFQIRYTR
ncbi:helix-turn-helix domain-containing protein [Anoxybacillus sp. LAT_26]|uniref:helix-turn-helix domain-containing protein n=1 Tax=Anoxybacillus sp. LAT_26 TaxID=2862719 RepID=UPI001EEA7DFB|nr:helix-turn-helix domain-containing protein [Anoxybacillus sp. LAT_26]